MSYGIGQPVPRTEDPRFLKGVGAFMDDSRLAGLAHACMVYAARTHATIKSVDTSKAEEAPGVLLVHTAADAKETAKELSDSKKSKAVPIILLIIGSLLSVAGVVIFFVCKPVASEDGGSDSDPSDSEDSTSDGCEDDLEQGRAGKAPQF